MEAIEQMNGIGSHSSSFGRNALHARELQIPLLIGIFDLRFSNTGCSFRSDKVIQQDA